MRDLRKIDHAENGCHTHPLAALAVGGKKVILRALASIWDALMKQQRTVLQVAMFGFRSHEVAGDSDEPYDEVQPRFLSIDSELQEQLRKLCRPIIQTQEQGPQNRCWQLERSYATPTGSGTILYCPIRLPLHHCCNCRQLMWLRWQCTVAQHAAGVAVDNLPYCC